MALNQNQNKPDIQVIKYFPILDLKKKKKKEFILRFNLTSESIDCMDQMVPMMSSLNEYIVEWGGENAQSVTVMRGRENDQYLMKNEIYFTPRYIYEKK